MNILKDLKNILKGFESFSYKDREVLAKYENQVQEFFNNELITHDETMLITKDENLDIKVNDIITYKDITYKIYRIEIYSEVLLRLFLKRFELE